MTKLRLLALLALVALLLLPVVALAAEQPPQQPCRFYGTVSADGYNVPDAMVIKAMIAGDVYQTTTPPEGYGPSSYAVKMIPGNKTYAGGEAVTFMIGDRAAEQTGNWTAGGNIELNLTAGGPPQPTPGAGGITDAKLGDHTGYDAATGGPRQQGVSDQSANVRAEAVATATGVARWGAGGLRGHKDQGAISRGGRRTCQGTGEGGSRFDGARPDRDDRQGAGGLPGRR